jgi:hypothetical protein
LAKLISDIKNGEIQSYGADDNYNADSLDRELWDRLKTIGVVVNDPHSLSFHCSC